MATPSFAESRPVAFLNEKLQLFPAFVVEALVFCSFFFLYFIARGSAPTNVELATDNAVRIVDLQRTLGFFWEPDMQAAVIDNDRLMDVANFTYRFLHLPVVGVLGVLFFLTDLRKYRVLRNAFLLSCLIGIPFYHLFPVTPPRLLDDHGVYLGFVDSLEGLRQAKPGSLANQYAAVPSYHFGWIMLITIGAAWCWRSAIITALGLAFLTLMCWAIIVTANHYILDMVAGGIAVALALALAYTFERWADRNPERVARFTFTIRGHRLPF